MESYKEYVDSCTKKLQADGDKDDLLIKVEQNVQNVVKSYIDQIISLGLAANS
jgi:hypothetical protein